MRTITGPETLNAFRPGALKELHGNQTEVAKRLGIWRSTLWRKMKQYGVSAPA
jgi:transcriptional regulator of acetoin/glycerol metabolism